MANLAFNHTVAIFDRLWQTLPPLVPHQVVFEMGNSVKQLKTRADATMTEIEEALIAWGKIVWPYRQAFGELRRFYEDKVGQVFLRVQLPQSLQDRCRQFHEQGGSFRDIVQGPPQSFFTEEERVLLRDACMRAIVELDAHTAQGAVSVDRSRYEGYVSTYESALRSIERELEELRQMADREEDQYADLAREIRSHVRACEYGLCALGPMTPLHAFGRGQEHFLGRKIEKKMAV